MTLAKLAQSAASTVSESYKFIDTQRVTELLADFGFTEDRYKQHRARSPERAGFQKHVSIFNRGVDTDGEGSFNLMLLNSHDGTSSLRLEAGFFRILCENQLVHGEAGIRVTHRGDALSKLEQSIPLLFKQLEDFKALRDRLRGQAISHDLQTALAELACELRGVDLTERNICNFIRPRRRADTGLDAWTNYNVVQENVVRGGIRAEKTDKSGETTYRKLTALSATDRIMEVNKALAVLITGGTAAA